MKEAEPDRLTAQTHSQADSVADAAANLIHENSARHMGRSVTNVRPKDILLDSVDLKARASNT